jgi:uncharacterized protein YlxP (DUF503 family)
MVIGILQMDILLTDTRSLKDKRSQLSRIKQLVRTKFNVSIAELQYGDRYSRTLFGVTCINNDSKIVHRILRHVEELIENQTGIRVIERKVELI